MRLWTKSVLAVLTISVPAVLLGQAPPLGPEFQANTYTTGGQGFPAIASTGSGNFVVVWQSLDQDGSSEGVFGQRYSFLGAARPGTMRR